MKKTIAFTAILLIAAIFTFVFKFSNTSDKIDPSSVASSALSIEPIELVYLENLGLPNFTSTGLTYDSESDSWWIGDHGTDPTDPVQLIQINSDMSSVITSVQIEDHVNDGAFNLQGVAYDPVDDALWCAVGKSIVEVSKDGTIINEITNNDFKEYSTNGITFDPVDSSLWVLCFNQKLLHIDRSGNVTEEFEMNYADQDMIYVDENKIYITIGADYKGDKNYIAVFDKQSHEVTFDYKVTDSYAVEGLYIKDGYLYIVNDGLYHECSIPKTYISKYKFD